MKSTLRMRLLVSCGMLFTSCAVGQTWQTSWELFAKEIAPYPARSNNPADPDMRAKFEGRQVTWEGTVNKNAKYSETTRFVVEMTPQDFKVTNNMAVASDYSVKVTTLELQPKKGSLESWKKVPPGSKVKFKAVLKFPIYIILHGRSGVYFFFVAQDAEPLLPGVGQ